MPSVYIANESQEGTIDRLPLFVRIWDMLREVGVKEINLVGQPKGAVPLNEPRPPFNEPRP